MSANCWVWWQNAIEILNQACALHHILALADAGNVQTAMETLLAAIAIIKQSRVYQDERCQALVTSLKDCLVSINGNNSLRFAESTRTIPPIVTVESVIYLSKKKNHTIFFQEWKPFQGWREGQRSWQRAKTRSRSWQRRLLCLGRCRNISKTQRPVLEWRQGAGPGPGPGQAQIPQRPIPLIPGNLSKYQAHQNTKTLYIFSYTVYI